MQELNQFPTLAAVVSAVFGLCVGSFLNVVICRLPRGESIVVERSHCPACGHKLAWYDLVPVFSYLALGARCRYCRAPIAVRYPMVEMLTALLFLVCCLRFGFGLLLLKYLFLVSLLVAISFIDIDHFIIPNSLVLSGAVFAVVITPLAGDVGYLSALTGAAATGGFLFLVALCSRGGMGMGDIKLGLMTGLFLGWPLALVGLFIGACTGGLLGVILLAARIKSRKDPLPFGPFIAAGTLIALLWGGQVLGLLLGPLA